MCTIYYSVVHKRLLIVIGALYCGCFIFLVTWKCVIGHSDKWCFYLCVLQKMYHTNYKVNLCNLHMAFFFHLLDMFLCCLKRIKEEPHCIHPHQQCLVFET